MGSSKILPFVALGSSQFGVCKVEVGQVMAQPGGSRMLSKRVVLGVVALCCLFALTPSALLSQSATTGAVSGIVTDPTGAIVPGPTVTLTQQNTNVTQTTTTDSSGRYLFPPP